MPKVPLSQLITPGKKAFEKKDISPKQKTEILKKLKKARSEILRQFEFNPNNDFIIGPRPPGFHY